MKCAVCKAEIPEGVIIVLNVYDEENGARLALDFCSFEHRDWFDEQINALNAPVNASLENGGK